MSHWNHRVFKEVFDDGEEQYSVREVFYNDDGGIYAHMETPVDIAAESIDALREYLEWCLKSLDQPILEVGKVEFHSDGFDDFSNGNEEAEITGTIDTGDEKISDWNINTDDLENLAGSIK